MSDKKLIFESMCLAMSKIDGIAKNRNNAQQGFKFRGIDDVYNTLHSVFVECKLFTTSEILSVESFEKMTKNGGVSLYERYKIRYTFFAIDGSSISTEVVGIGMDSGDKAGNKAMAIAHKYALLQVFCIPTEDQKDPDAESHEVIPNRAAVKSVHDAQPDPSAAAMPIADAQPAKSATTVTGKTTITCVCPKVDTKSGIKDGKPWTKYAVCVDGVFYSTFSETFRDTLHRSEGQEVTIYYESNGKFNTITDVDGLPF